MKAIFLRVIEAEDKAGALRDAARTIEGSMLFEADPASFAAVPRSPFAYWVSDSVRQIFARLPGFHSGRSAVWSTNPLNEDFRYARAWWEPPTKLLGKTWMPWAKGGAYSSIYYDIHTVISWSSERESYGSFIGTANRPLTRPASVQHFFRPGLTWPRRTNGLSFRVMPAGCIFADKGPAAFVEGDDPEELLALCAVVNSAPFGALVALQLARTELAQSYEVGVIQRTPVPDLDAAARARLAALARRAWSVKRGLDTRTETSHAFVLPALLQVPDATLRGRAEAWRARVARAEGDLAAIQAEIDEICFALYGIDGEDRKRIELGFGGAEEVSGEPDDDVDEVGEPAEVDPVPLVTSLLSWAMGGAFGRFDLRLATGEREPPPEPVPFDPLPACSPGMLTGEGGLPVDSPPRGYPIDFPRDGVLVDDRGHERDLVAQARRVFEVVFGDDADARWREAAEILDERGSDLRAWFARAFFEDHIKRYSKSRRKAPIYWQLATPSASYSVWLYYHRFTRDTLYRVLNDYVAPKLKHEERKLTNLTQEAGPNSSAGQRKEIDAQERFVTELRAFRDEVARVAPLWNPDLNDGVIINFAPLWRLVPQHRAWQKECKKVWDKLVAGDYDWAHLAMHLWPERVVPKCAKDRSLAIAHGLEDVFWEEDEGGKWHEKTVSKDTIETLIEERTSPAVKAALEDLLGASEPTRSARARRSGGRRRRAPRAPASAPRPRGNGTPVRPALDARTLEAVKQAIAAAGDGASKSDVMGATGISASEWNAAIGELLAQGVVTKTGAGRGIRYHLQGGD